MTFEAEAMQLGGGVRQVVSLHPSLSPFSPFPFPFPLSFQTNQWEGRSDPVRGEVPRLPPTNITLPNVKTQKNIH